MAFVGARRTRRTNNRLARLRLSDPKALPNIKADSRYKPREVREVRVAARAAKKAERADKKKKAANSYNPLAPVTGPNLRKEMTAAEQLEFGGRAEDLQQRTANQEQTTANTGSYYDDYRAALAEATSRINAANAENVAATEGRIDTAYQHDKAAVQARDAAASAQAANLGRGPVQSEEGARAVEAQRSQGNQSLARLRAGSVADTRYMESRGANAALGKAQAVAREQARERQLGREGTQLEKEKGAFRVDFRRQSRQDERQWAAIQQEFGLDKAKLRLDKKQQRMDQKQQNQATNAQKIVARIYASADKASARAQVRVAKLQLKKGRIDQKQFKTIKNIYEGLPSGGSSGGGSGGKPKLQTWERDKVSNAVHILEKNKAKPDQQAKWIAAMQDEGMPARLARIAWSNYVKRFRSHPAPQTPGPNGQTRPN
jgi:hypothetical protein